MNVPTKELLDVCREYADHDEYHVTRSMIRELCNRLERSEAMQKNFMNIMLDEKQNFLDAERYRWIRNGAWDVNQAEVAPTLVMCNGDMSEYTWLYGDYADRMIDKWMMEKTK